MDSNTDAYRAEKPGQHGVIAPIQYLRGIAALLVVLFHAMNNASGFDEINMDARFVPSGIDLFFVISGFIMWVTTATKPITPREFITRRIIRIVPLYWLTTFAMVSLSFIPGMLGRLRVTIAAIVQSLLFIPYDSISFPGHVWPVLEPGWTLNYEMFFYALFTLSLVLHKRIRFGAIVGLLCFLAFMGFIFGPFQSPMAAIYTSMLLLEFAAGILIGNLWINGYLRPGSSVSLLAIISGFFMLSLQQNYQHTVGALLVVAGVLDPAICALRSRLLLLLGDASYSIYLTHMFVLGAMGVIWRHIFPHASRSSAVLFVAAVVLVSSVLGLLCYRLIEQQITVRLQQMTRPKRVVAFQNAKLHSG